MRRTVQGMTNEEVVRNMSRDELGSFLCSLTIKCEYCELKDLCRTKYGKGFYDWLGSECNGDIYDGFWSVENLPDCSIKRDFTPIASLCEETWVEKRERLTKQIEKWLEEWNHFSISTIKHRKEIDKLLKSINNNASKEEYRRISYEFDDISIKGFKDRIKRFVYKLIKRQ